MRRVRAAILGATFAVFGAVTPAGAQPTAAVASAHPLANDAGRVILERGGNAFDAAVATAAALAVVEPYSSGLGGGGFFLRHRVSDRREVMVDARETAPGAVTESLYIDADGRPIKDATTSGGKAAGIPGMPAGLVHVARTYGKLPLSVSLAPAIRLAREGFRVDQRFARIAKLRETYLRNGVNTSVYLDRGNAPEAGFVLRQPELGATLERIALRGADGFYRGPVAQALVETVNRAGGVWRASDLEGYRVVEREPVRFTYRGARVTTAALPSAGGIALAQALGMLERFAIETPRNPGTAHLAVEALRRVFQDRARYLGDPDFVRVPVERLVSREYVERRAADIDRARASVSDALAPLETARAPSSNTTHLSVVDAAGNRVAATLTINLLFGSGIAAAGVLVNNEMDDFSLRDDVPNAFRLRGGLANRVEPGKRPLSSMSPTFVEDARGVLVLGAPGGSRIVSQVLLAILDYVHMPDVDLQRIVAAPRYHHQFWPDRVEVEPQAFGADWLADLAARGHKVQAASRAWGNMQAVYKARSGIAQAASDPRGESVAWY